MNHAQHLATTLTRHHLTLATAESCTGGGLSYELTSIPGSSAFFVGGVIAYHNDVKMKWLGVPAETLQHHGAVSRPVAAAMAEGCRSRFATDLAISITGIAGPSGGVPDKPVGLVYVAAATSDGTVIIERRFAGNRAEIRKAAIAAAIDLLLDILDGRTQAPS